MEIKGTRFVLRRWQRSDAQSLQKLADNTKIAANLYDRFPSPYSIDDAHFFIGLKIDENPVTSFAIEVDGHFAGTIGMELRQDVFAKAPLIGYWLGEGYWGRGIATEALQLLTAYAFDNFDIICLQAGVFSSNLTSMRVLQKAGYTNYAILPQTITKNGETLDEHIYLIYPGKSKRDEQTAI